MPIPEILKPALLHPEHNTDFTYKLIIDADLLKAICFIYDIPFKEVFSRSPNTHEGTINMRLFNQYLIEHAQSALSEEPSDE